MKFDPVTFLAACLLPGLLELFILVIEREYSIDFKLFLVPNRCRGNPRFLDWKLSSQIWSAFVIQFLAVTDSLFAVIKSGDVFDMAEKRKSVVMLK